MAGYGNRTAPEYTASSLEDDHSNTRLGLTDSYSPPSYGAGFGNKRASQPSISPSTSAGSETGAEATRFNTQDTHGNAPYSNAHTYGSASTAGAGWGNKTGSFSSEGREEQHGSKIGKVMQKLGGALHAPGLVARGQAKKAEGGAEAGEETLPPAN